MSIIQGASAHPLGGYLQHQLMDPGSVHGWPFGPLATKREVLDENKNESGVHSPSPENHRYTSPQPPTHPMGFYATPQFRPNTNNQYNVASSAMLTHATPPTPPDSIPMVSPKSERTSSPDNFSTTNYQNQNGEEVNKKQQDDERRKLEEMHERETIVNFEDCTTVPRLNSHGKLKQMKCKQCNFVAITKDSYWDHVRDHIKPEKRMECKKCRFVTEYKHHMEYHLMNHDGVKPYGCNECNYRCVSKSMLASHKKSHSNIYQYRCANCSYATKYIHSLKQHCRKHSHKAAMVLNPDGTPNPVPIIDVYGSRRGPKIKPPAPPQDEPRPESLPFGYMPPLQSPVGINRLSLLPNNFFHKFAQMLQDQALAGTASNLAQIMQQQQAMISQIASNPGGNAGTTMVDDGDDSTADESLPNSEVLDLSVAHGGSGSSGDGEKPGPSRNRRKGPAYKVPQASQNDSSDDDDDLDQDDSEPEENVPVPDELNNNQGSPNTCTHCEMIFGDPVMYTMHMGLHGYGEPFTCNVCGEKCDNRIAFFLHVTRTAH